MFQNNLNLMARIPALFFLNKDTMLQRKQIIELRELRKHAKHNPIKQTKSAKKNIKKQSPEKKQAKANELKRLVAKMSKEELANIASLIGDNK